MNKGRIRKFAQMSYEALKSEIELDPDCAEVNFTQFLVRKFSGKLGCISWALCNVQNWPNSNSQSRNGHAKSINCSP